MNATRRRVGTDEEPQSPQVPASQIATGLHDHSFTLQAIMELQKSKRDLADAIVSADMGLLKRLTSSDLEVLLS